jgi:hypothetical protein
LNQENIDIIQTAAIIFNGVVLAYVVWRLERAFENAAGKLTSVITHQREIQEGVERAWKRIDEIETQQGTRQTVAPLGKLQEQMTALAARVGAFEAAQQDLALQNGLKAVADRLEAIEKRLPPENQFPISWAGKNNR